MSIRETGRWTTCLERSRWWEIRQYLMHHRRHARITVLLGNESTRGGCFPNIRVACPIFARRKQGSKEIIVDVVAVIRAYGTEMPDRQFRSGFREAGFFLQQTQGGVFNQVLGSVPALMATLRVELPALE